MGKVSTGKSWRESKHTAVPFGSFMHKDALKLHSRNDYVMMTAP